MVQKELAGRNMNKIPEDTRQRTEPVALLRQSNNKAQTAFCNHGAYYLLKRVLLPLMLIMLLAALFAVGGCADRGSPKISFGVLKGPSGIGAVYLMEQDGRGETISNYNFTIAGAPDALIAQLISGELNAAALPSSTAATLYQKSEGRVLALAVSTLGVLYFLENGNKINGIEDLAGKTIVTSGQGSTVEYVLSYLLAAHGLRMGEDVTVDFKSEHTEAATLAAAGNYEIALLPEPFVTILLNQNNEFRIALDITAQWEQAGMGRLPMGVIAVNKDFASKNTGLITAFLSEYKTSVEYANGYPVETAALTEKYDIMPAAIAEKAIPRANIVYIAGPEMKNMLGAFYRILYDFNPAATGGSLPDDDFYYYR